MCSILVIGSVPNSITTGTRSLCEVLPKNKMKMFKSITIVAAILLFIGVFPLPYVYYQFLRVIIFACGAIIAYLFYKKARGEWMAIFALISLFFNPFFPISMQKEAWVLVDLICAGLFLYSQLLLTSKKQKEG